MEGACLVVMLEGDFVCWNSGNYLLNESVSASMVESRKCCVFVSRAFHGHGSFEFEDRESRCLNTVCVSFSTLHLVGYAIDTSCGRRALIWNPPSVSHRPYVLMDGSRGFAF